MEQIKLAAKPREAIGSKSVKRLRDEGKIPGVVYGRAFGDSVAIVIESRDLRAALSHGAHSVINLEIEGRGPTPVLLHDRQLDPVTKRLLHVDLHSVNLNEEVETTVRVVAVGTATGVKNGGILDIVMREITVAALPGSIPDHIDVDVRDLDITDAVHVRGRTAGDRGRALRSGAPMTSSSPYCRRRRSKSRWWLRSPKSRSSRNSSARSRTSKRSRRRAVPMWWLADHKGRPHIKSLAERKGRPHKGRHYKR